MAEPDSHWVHVPPKPVWSAGLQDRWGHTRLQREARHRELNSACSEAGMAVWSHSSLSSKGQDFKRQSWGGKERSENATWFHAAEVWGTWRYSVRSRLGTLETNAVQ